MSARKQNTQEKGPEVPVYIVTFSDMVTLLLTFFVLLISLSSTQEELMFKKGLDSFREALIKFGLVGFTYGRRMRPDFGNIKYKYIIDKDRDQFEGRMIDVRGQRTRQLFTKLSGSMKTVPSQIVGKQPNFIIADIHFDHGAAELNESAKQFLATFSSALQQNRGPVAKHPSLPSGTQTRAVTLYVVGLAESQPSQQQQWILSAQRAQAVADFLKGTLPSDSNRRIYSWGAGPGGDWAVASGATQQQSHILIGVLQ